MGTKTEIEGFATGANRSLAFYSKFRGKGVAEYEVFQFESFFFLMHLNA